MGRDLAPLAGDIRYFRLPEILQLVSLQRLTGRLTLSHDGQGVEIFIRNGHVAFAWGEKRGSREQLGYMLVNMGCLDMESLEKALEKSARTGERLGKVLAGERLAGRKDITAALIKQTERSVCKAMAWGEGRFAFELCGMPDFVEDIPLELRVEDLILEGVRRIGEGRVIAEKIPTLDIVFTKPIYSAGDIEKMGLKEDERLVMDLIDGAKDVKGLLDVSGLSQLSLLRALYALYSAGIIKKLEPSVKTYRTQYL